MVQGLPVERLLDPLAGHDSQAWEELFDFLGPRVWPMLRRILPDRAVAEEVLQQAFQQLENSAPLLRRQGGSLVVWFVAVTRQLALDRLRGATVLPASRPAGADPLADMLACLPRPEAVRRLEERMGLLKKVVDQLPKPQREVLGKAFFEGCPEAEIALGLGLPLAKVSTELRSALLFLRHRLRAVLGIWPANI